MIKEAFEWLYAHTNPTTTITLEDGREVLIKPGGWESLGDKPLPGPIVLATLSGLADFISAHVDADMNRSRTFVTCAPGEVWWQWPLEGHRRQCRAKAVYGAVDKGFSDLIETPWSLQGAVEFLLSSFADSEDRDRLIELLSDVSVENVVFQKRKGLGWAVSSQRGLNGDFNEVESPFFNLAPWRMFPEAGPQPASRFAISMLVPDDAGRDAGRDQVRVQISKAHGDEWYQPACQAVALEMQRLLGDRDAGEVSVVA